MRLVSASHQRETMLPAPLESSRQEHHYGERVDRMSQKQHEALDESDLNQNVSQADSDEIQQTDRTKLPAPGAHRQRHNQKPHHRQERNGENHAQDGHAQINFPVHALLQRAGTQDLS